MTDTTQQVSTEGPNANISGEQEREPPPAELRPTQPTDVLVNGAVRSPRKRQHRSNFLAPKVTIKIEDDDDDSLNQVPTSSSNGVSNGVVKADKLVQTEEFNMERALVAIVQKRMVHYEATLWKDPAIKKCNSLQEENDALKKRTKLLEERLLLLESGGKMDTSTGKPASDERTPTPTTSPTKAVTPPCAPPPLVRSVDDAKAAASTDTANATGTAMLRSPPIAAAAGRGQPSRRFQHRRLQHHPTRQQNPPNFQPYDGGPPAGTIYRPPLPSSANISPQLPPYATAAMRFTQPMYVAPYYAAPDPTAAAATLLQPLNTTVVPSNQGGQVRMASASALVNGHQRPIVQLGAADPRFRPPFPAAAPGMQINTMNNQHLQHLQPRPNAPTRPIALQQASMTWPPNSAGSAPLAPPPQLPCLKASISASSSGIILTWDYEVHPKPGQRYEVECYHLFAHQAREAHVPAPTDISEWKKIGVVNALPLPMACTLTQFATGNVYHFAVLAVSLKGREGPLSNPCTIRLNLNSK